VRQTYVSVSQTFSDFNDTVSQRDQSVTSQVTQISSTDLGHCRPN